MAVSSKQPWELSRRRSRPGQGRRLALGFREEGTSGGRDVAGEAGREGPSDGCKRHLPRERRWPPPAGHRGTKPPWSLRRKRNAFRGMVARVGCFKGAAFVLT
jgi:hypothetical protein